MSHGPAAQTCTFRDYLFEYFILNCESGDCSSSSGLTADVTRRALRGFDVRRSLTSRVSTEVGVLIWHSSNPSAASLQNETRQRRIEPATLCIRDGSYAHRATGAVIGNQRKDSIDGMLVSSYVYTQLRSIETNLLIPET